MEKKRIDTFDELELLEPKLICDVGSIVVKRFQLNFERFRCESEIFWLHLTEKPLKWFLSHMKATLFISFHFKNSTSIENLVWLK